MRWSHAFTQSPDGLLWQDVAAGAASGMGSSAGNFAAGAASGAASGAVAGPYGALVGAIIGGAMNLYAANRAANAATGAAATQSEAATRAAQFQYQASLNSLDFAKQVYAQQRADQAPWLSAGRGAVTSLSNLMGVPMMGGPATSMGATGGPPSLDQMPGSIHPFARPGQATPTNAEFIGTAVPRGTPPSMATPLYNPGTTAGARSLASVGSSSYGTGTVGKVRMRAPDGSTEYVDPTDVSHYTSMGAQVIG